MTYARRVDTTQKEIVAALRGVGALVWIVGGAVDLVCQFRGKIFLIDAKAGQKRRTATQTLMIEDGWPIWFPQSGIDALEIIGAVKYEIGEKR